jgi:hypothetical protein
MESWKNGRKDLLEQLTKICDRIGANVVAGELTHRMAGFTSDSRIRGRRRGCRDYRTRRATTSSGRL